MKHLYGLFGVVPLLAGCAGTPSTPSPASLTWKWRPGQVLRYETMDTATFAQGAMTGRMSTASKVRQRVIDVGGAGEAVARIAYEAMSHQGDGMPFPAIQEDKLAAVLKGSSFAVGVDSRGRVLAVEGSDGIVGRLVGEVGTEAMYMAHLFSKGFQKSRLQQMYVVLPAEPIQAGATWSDEFLMALEAPEPVAITRISTLVSVEQGEAHIEHMLTGRNTSSSLEGRGRSVFLVDSGVLRSTDLEWTLTVDFAGQKMSMRGTNSVKLVSVELDGGPAEAEAPKRETSIPDDAVQWLRANSIPLATPQAGHGFADLQPLRAIVGDARIVALGEATHGTREFFQLKHRMLEFLVEEMGFTVFAIEANLPEAFAVNDYVLHGRGDPAEALTGLYFWTWDTEEVLEMIRWMRRYNEDAAHPRKVKFYGFDMQVPMVAARRVAEYLAKVDGDAAAEIERAIAPLSDERRFMSEPLPRELRETVEGMVGQLDERRADYVARAGADEWDVARQCAVVVRQAVATRGEEASMAGFAGRDRSMAENVKWILDREGPDAKIVLWAHNGHVQVEANWMGHFLRRKFGQGLVVFGFAFQEGSFQAMHAREGLRNFTVGPAAEATLDVALAKVEMPLFAVDFRGAKVAFQKAKEKLLERK